MYSKASSRLGLLKRTLHFVKCQKQKRAFYLAIVRSQFEHCVQVWRPTSDALINKLEKIQKRAVKWILSEQDLHYNDLEYANKLRDLDLLPLKYRFMLSDLLLFYDIYNNKSCVKLPECYKPITNEDKSRLRRTIKPPDYLGGNETFNLENMRKNKNDDLSLKCVSDAHSSILRKSFFFRGHMLWNHLPLNIREERSPSKFKAVLILHLWEVVMKPD